MLREKSSGDTEDGVRMACRLRVTVSTLMTRLVGTPAFPVSVTCDHEDWTRHAWFLLDVQGLARNGHSVSVSHKSVPDPHCSPCLTAKVPPLKTGAEGEMTRHPPGATSDHVTAGTTGVLGLGPVGRATPQ